MGYVDSVEEIVVDAIPTPLNNRVGLGHHSRSSSFYSGSMVAPSRQL